MGRRNDSENRLPGAVSWTFFSSCVPPHFWAAEHSLRDFVDLVFYEGSWPLGRGFIVFSRRAAPALAAKLASKAACTENPSRRKLTPPRFSRQNVERATRIYLNFGLRFSSNIGPKKHPHQENYRNLVFFDKTTRRQPGFTLISDRVNFFVKLTPAHCDKH